MSAQPSPARRATVADPSDQALEYMRRLGIGMLIASMVLDVGWQQWQGIIMRKARLEYRLRRRIDPPGPILAATAISLLESTSRATREP